MCHLDPTLNILVYSLGGRHSTTSGDFSSGRAGRKGRGPGEVVSCLFTDDGLIDALIDGRPRSESANFCWPDGPLHQRAGRPSVLGLIDVSVGTMERAGRCGRGQGSGWVIRGARGDKLMGQAK